MITIENDSKALLADIASANKLIKFIQYVCTRENLDNIEIKFWNISGEGECIEFRDKQLTLIYLDFRNRNVTDTQILFLHKIAHMNIKDQYDNRNHGPKWRAKNCTQLHVIRQIIVFLPANYTTKQ